MPRANEPYDLLEKEPPTMSDLSRSEIEELVILSRGVADEYDRWQPPLAKPKVAIQLLRDNADALTALIIEREELRRALAGIRPFVESFARNERFPWAIEVQAIIDSALAQAAPEGLRR